MRGGEGEISGDPEEYEYSSWVLGPHREHQGGVRRITQPKIGLTRLGYRGEGTLPDSTWSTMIFGLAPRETRREDGWR